MIELHKYSGAGNDFVVLDGRKEDVSEFRTPERIAALCDRRTGFAAADGRIGADGLMILTGDPDYDFRMEYYNSDGSGGMMCGNGGRCIVAFADALGLKPADGRVFRFVAADGEHTGEILAREGDCKRTSRPSTSRRKAARRAGTRFSRPSAPTPTSCRSIRTGRCACAPSRRVWRRRRSPAAPASPLPPSQRTSKGRQLPFLRYRAALR